MVEKLIITHSCNYIIVIYLAFNHKSVTIYRTEGNFGGRKLWRIWRMTINSPKFPPTKILAAVGVTLLHVLAGVSGSFEYISQTSIDNVDSISLFALLPSLKSFAMKVNIQGNSRPLCGRSEE